MGSLRAYAAAFAAFAFSIGCAEGDATSRQSTPPVTPTVVAGSGAAGATGGIPSSIGTPQRPPVGQQQPPMMQQPPPAGMANPIEPVSIDECQASNPAGLGAADAAKLMAGSGSADGMRMLYPYDGTVFPRGLLAPLLMWEGADAAESVYVHIKAMRFEYKGCLKPTAPGQLPLPQAIWDIAGQKTMGPTDPFLLELTVMSGGAVKGPMRIELKIAQATIKGSIFYNSYSSRLPGGEGTGFGAIGGLPPGGFLPPGFGAGMGSGSVLRIPPGGTAERFTSMECNGCHSVSASGSRLLSQAIPSGGVSFALAPDTKPNPPSMAAGPLGAYGALYPDGSHYLTTSTAVDVARSSLAGIGGPGDATLYQTDTGMVVPNTGIPKGALMPMFSPDGKMLTFNDAAVANAHGLALMDYDVATNTATNHRVLYMDSEMRPAWPFVLPDNRAVLFARTDSVEFSGEGAGLAGVPAGPRSELYVADIATGTVTILARAMGYLTPADVASGKTNLPFGADDLGKNYYPTVSPVAAGGYFWIFFDSVRHFGNLGVQRQLWGAAISIAPDGSYTTDLSHPSFYLPGQEFGTGNHRAFAALDPCKKDGNMCTSGTDCCGGFCYVTVPDTEFGEPVGSCTSEIPRCSKTNERCGSSADCCPPAPGQPANTCIAGFCAYVPPVE